MSKELPSYSVFDDTEDEGVSSRWEDWIEGLDSMLRAMEYTDKTKKYDKLNFYLNSTGKTLKKLPLNGMDSQDIDRADSSW